MKTIILGLLVLTFNLGAAQEYYHLDKESVDYKSFGFSEPVAQVEVAHFKSDENGYETTMYELYVFNKEHQIVTKYNRIFGDYASETSHQYIYENQILDSLNTYASAKSFNSKSHFKYKDNKVSERLGTGVYTNYEDNYTYDSESRLKQVKRTYPKGNSTESNYTYLEGKLHLVEEITTDLNGGKSSTFFYYVNDEVVVKHNVSFNSVVFYDVNMANYTTNTIDRPLPLIEKFVALKKTATPQDVSKFIDESVGQAEIIKQNLANSSNMKGDWLSRYQMTSNYGGETKRYIFRKIVYANGEVSGSTDFNHMFFQKTKGL